MSSSSSSSSSASTSSSSPSVASVTTFTLPCAHLPSSCLSSFEAVSSAEQHAETVLHSAGAADRRQRADVKVQQGEFAQHAHFEVDGWRGHAHLRVKKGAKFYVGSGCLFSLNYPSSPLGSHSNLYVVTAAHCVGDMRHDEFDAADAVWVTLPGITQYLSVTDVEVHPQYATKPGFDIALLRIPFTSSSLSVDLRAFHPPYFCPCLIGDPVDEAASDPVHVSSFALYGYPAEKKGELWGHSFELEAALKPDDVIKTDTIYYDVDTSGGQSGAPLMVVMPTFGFGIFAIHQGNAGKKNKGSVITEDKFNWIKTFFNRFEKSETERIHLCIGY